MHKQLLNVKHPFLLITLCILMYSTHSSAENPTAANKQRSLPIAIEADSAEQNEQQGLTVYRGHVTMTQGDLRIEASEVNILSLKNEILGKRKINKITAKGDPAVFSHRDEDNQEVVAQADQINYTPASGTVVMQGDASLVQQGSSVRGNRIEYFISEKKVKAAADPKAQSGRVKTIITPGQGFSFKSAVNDANQETSTPRITDKQQVKH